MNIFGRCRERCLPSARTQCYSSITGYNSTFSSSGFDCVKGGVNALIIGFGPEIPLAAFVILVNAHERCAGEIGDLASDTAIGFVGIDALDGPADSEIADLIRVPIGIEQDLEITVVIAFSAFFVVITPGWDVDESVSRRNSDALYSSAIRLTSATGPSKFVGSVGPE
jgi:hypothetical protein